jgi:hypothetical protein
MKMLPPPLPARGPFRRLLLPVLVLCALALAFAGQAMGASGETDWSAQVVPPAPGGAVATLEQCETTGEQTDRSATFSGEMTAITGTARMAMRIEVQERLPGEELFHTVSAPGLGVWRGSASGVKIYQYVKQITNLSSPAVYRALIHFHWLNDKGYVTRRAERHTATCTQPASVLTPTPVVPGGTTAGGTTVSPGAPSTAG